MDNKRMLYTGHSLILMLCLIVPLMCRAGGIKVCKKKNVLQNISGASEIYL